MRRLRVKLATDVREPVDLPSFRPPDWFLSIRHGNRLEASHRHPLYAAAAGLVLDLLAALNGNPAAVAVNLGVSTTRVIKLLEAETAVLGGRQPRSELSWDCASADASGLAAAPHVPILAVRRIERPIPWRCCSLTDSLEKSFGPRTIFRGLSIRFDDTERTGLIGPNGSGKSTLLKILAGVEQPDAGTIESRRQPAARLPAAGGRVPGRLDAAAGRRRRAARQPRPRRRARAARSRRRSCSARSASSGPTSRSKRSPAGGASGWRSRASWSASPTCCCSTSRRTTSTSKASSGWRSC